MSRRNWFECNTCRMRHAEVAPGLAVYVCPHCSGTAITALPSDGTEAVSPTASTSGLPSFDEALQKQRRG